MPLLNEELANAKLYFKDLPNAERHPKSAIRMGQNLIAEVERLRTVLKQISGFSYSVEENAKWTWKDIAVRAETLAKDALAVTEIKAE
jgi:hypothetical protein